MAKKVTTDRDSLASVLADSLNKKFKDYKVAYFLDGSEDTPTDLTEWISTGSSMLDIAISNRPNGGIPVGRITEITGLEGSGKSLMAAHLLANTQKKGGLAVYIDTENAMNEEFARAIGIDIKNMLYIQLETIEEIFEVMENIVTKIRESDKDRLVTIAVDSLAAATTKVESEADYSKDGWATSKAIILSKAMRKITQMIGRQRIALIFTNQLRQKMGVMFGDPWTTSGGKAIAFHSSCRLRLKAAGQIKATVNGQAQTIGIKTKAQVVKNRMGPPLRTAEFDIYFDSGIDDFGGWLQVLKAYKLIKQGGSWYTFTRADGTELKCTSKTWKDKLADNEELRTEVYDLICKTLVMDYKTENLGIDDVEHSDEPVPEG
jgi:recombination protein RecA